jgi:surface antigen
VPYARLRSGLQIFGDAKLWWSKARDLYAQVAQPMTDAVMVFSGSKRITRGHVAVVTEVISPREIRVDHANWQNRGEIDLNMPVLDVSARNDWSAVRVWNVNTNSYGTHVYQVSGFHQPRQDQGSRALTTFVRGQAGPPSG